MFGELRYRGSGKASVGFTPLEEEPPEKTLERVFGIPQNKVGSFETALQEVISGDGDGLKNILTLKSSALCCLLHLYDKAGTTLNLVHEDGRFPFHVEWVKFEEKNPVLLFENENGDHGPPMSNVDAMLLGKDEEGHKVRLYLESKFTEYIDHYETYRSSRDKNASYMPFYEKWLSSIPGLTVVYKEGMNHFISQSPRYLEGIKQICSHVLGMMSARGAFDGKMYFGVVVCPLKGKRLDSFRQDYRLLAARVNERVGHLGIHMLPDLLFYGRDIEAGNSKVRLFYGENEFPEVGAFFYIYGRILREKEPFVPEEGNRFVNGRVGHEELYRLLQLRGHMATLDHDDYSYWPRGRVIYDLEEGRTLVYMDSCIITDPYARKALEKTFRLGEDVVFLKDEHYRCHRCDKEIRRWDEEDNSI